MSNKDIIRGRIGIRITAIKEGKSFVEMEKFIQDAIDEAWGKTGDFELQQELFPNGKPSPAEFIGVLGRYLRENTEE